ncbi:hypothetical protein [Actinoplanes subtropicus]|uniref:hypothetical protein n=1 Tax=Actinoplanes subtropicus TaxID=543632 RepID=UPI0004C2D77A|nr:hypothetical protein [Actinoplanes subtropicus]
MLSATRHLLTSLDPLAHRERLRRLAGWARTAPDRAEVCADLRGLGGYERHLALIASMVVRDDAGFEAALADPRPSVRAAALSAAARAGLLGRVRPDLSAMERRRVYRQLRRLRAPESADALIGWVHAEFGDEAGALLPACGEAVVRALLPELEHAIDAESVMRRHPGVFLERTGARLATAGPEDRERIWDQVGYPLLDGDPPAVLDLLGRYAPRTRLPGSLTAYGRLAAHDPQRVLELLTAPDRAAWIARAALPPALLRRLAVLPVDRLVRLARIIRINDGTLAALLDAVPPARRGALYDGALGDVNTAEKMPSTEVMDVLPEALRIREATRVLRLPKVRESEDDTRWWSSFLAWPEASAALAEALRSGAAGERGQAYRMLVSAARLSRDPQVIAELVDRLGRLRNEQDPVRSTALTALRSAARLLSAACAPALTRITTDAVEARDGSFATTAALSSLAADTLQHHVDVPELREWALLTIDLVGSTAQAPVLRRFDTVLRRGQEALVFDRLSGWVTGALERGHYGPLFALTGALGKRAWRVPGLQELLLRATTPRNPEWAAHRAIELWLANPRGRGDRVARLLAADRTTVTIPIVWQTLCAARTDLLDLVLDHPPRGRFVADHLRWVPHWTLYAERWLPRQHAAYLRLQERAAADTGAGPRPRAVAIRAAAPIPELGRELVLRYVDSPDVVLAEAALSALVWIDRPAEMLPLLLSHAGDDRARVALYAAGRAVRFLPPSRVPALLLPVLLDPGAKVTSRKAVARLIARYGPPGVMGELLDAYADPQAHRDVRAAIVAAARLRLDTAASWSILDTARHGSREECRAVLAADVSTVAVRHRPRYAALIVEACRADDREVRRTAFQRVGGWAPWAGDLTELVVGRLVDLDVRTVDVEVAQLLQTTRGRGLDLTFDRLAAGGLGEPERRRIELLASGAAKWSRAAPLDTDRSGPVAAARQLATLPSFAGTALRMLVALGRLDNLDELADRCAGRPLLAVRTAALVSARTTELRHRIDAGFAQPAVRRLAGRGDLAGGLFAVALTRPGVSFGWSAPWRGLLLQLREHPDPDVREEAYSVDLT